MPRYDYNWGTGYLYIYNLPGNADAAATEDAVGNGQNDVLVMDVSGATFFYYTDFTMGDWNSYSTNDTDQENATNTDQWFIVLPTGWYANLEFVRADDDMFNSFGHDYSTWIIYDAGGTAKNNVGYFNVIGDGTNVTFIDDINDAPPCFTAGQKVRCAGGRQVPIEKLTIGSLVETRDHGPLPVRWIGSSLVTGETLRQFPNRRPVKFAKDALGCHPAFSVSQQHRMFHDGAEERLIPAKFLVDGDRIAIDQDIDEVTYYHIMFDSHQIIEVDRIWSESFYPGDYIMGAVERQVAEEIRFFFPDLEAETAQKAYGPLSRKPVKKREVQLLLGPPG